MVSDTETDDGAREEQTENRSMARRRRTTRASRFDGYDFDRGDRVVADFEDQWAARDEVLGRVVDISGPEAHPVVSVVAFDEEDWPRGRTYDAAPEWIEVDHDARSP